MHDTRLGSRLKSLALAAPEAMEQTAMMYAREALADLPQVQPICAKLRESADGTVTGVEVSIKIMLTE